MTPSRNHGGLQVASTLALVVGLGLLSRWLPLGWSWYDKSLGDCLYAVAVYCALALAMPARWWGDKRWRLATVALAVCIGLEFFQATGIPARYAHFFIVRWLIGTTFAWHDVACYVVGIAFVFALDRLLLLRRARSFRVVALPSCSDGLSPARDMA